VVNPVDGFLNLNKPSGFTSHDCVAKVRRILKMKRVGHAGTLDPAATGVLPIALGKATRLLQYLRDDKAYRATLRLGLCTTTDDLEGEILAEHPAPGLDQATVEGALGQFLGTIQQVPPNYSAIQVQGQRLYDLARSGQAIAVPARTVEVFRIEVLAWRGGDFPEVDLAIACGPGTYIRAIARDLGHALGVGGTLASLLRTASSGFSLADSLTWEDVATQVEQQCFHPLPPQLALTHWPALDLPPDLARRWCQGQKIPFAAMGAAVPGPNTTIPRAIHRIQDQDGRFLGIGLAGVDANSVEVLVPEMVFEAV
jgi:tRNA pseudouridine55 synthase